MQLLKEFGTRSSSKMDMFKTTISRSCIIFLFLPEMNTQISVALNGPRPRSHSIVLVQHFDQAWRTQFALCFFQTVFRFANPEQCPQAISKRSSWRLLSFYTATKPASSQPTSDLWPQNFLQLNDTTMKITCTSTVEDKPQLSTRPWKSISHIRLG